MRLGQSLAAGPAAPAGLTDDGAQRARCLAALAFAAWPDRHRHRRRGRRRCGAAAHEAAWQRFQPLLAELVAELPRLRRPVVGLQPAARPVARRMWPPVPLRAHEFVTSMAAVAGAVAQELICRL
jgi:hypothetical protein